MRFRFAAIAVFVAIFALGAFAAPPRRASTSAVARGRYLVENVAMCADCHTPRGATGEFDRSRWLKGATLDFQPVHPIPGFATVAPPIAGLDWSASAATRLLETGVGIDGKPLAPPMPQYHMSHADASAVVAYLKSLPR